MEQRLRRQLFIKEHLKLVVVIQGFSVVHSSSYDSGVNHARTFRYFISQTPSTEERYSQGSVEFSSGRKKEMFNLSKPCNPVVDEVCLYSYCPCIHLPSSMFFLGFLFRRTCYMGRQRALFVLGASYEHSQDNEAKRFSTISAALSSRGLAKRLMSPRCTHS